ncbi:SUMF1/EgtB/PvdO family nonheme iron enzyme [candidate division KSB1 bacterium]|nr:SUMF1/EgtB/PvdO family nonheme iron enzyme [candidate division KSB1 bacterium]
MKTSICVLLISVLAVIGCIAQENPKNSVTASQIKNEADLLNFYRQYSTYTNPGEYAYLYKNLPDSLPALCSLIKSQFIHAYAELPKYRELIPKERGDETLKYPTVKSILKGLLSYDSAGLVKTRKPKDRLVLICRHNAILLASILKYRGIPARVRGGYATYIIPDFHTNHAICEVWNENEKRWMLVDPSMDMVDFSKDKFDFGNDAWSKMQKNEIDPSLFGIPGSHSGLASIVAIVCTDLAYILGTEYTIYQYAPILEYAFQNNNQLTSKHIETLNTISELMKSLDAENLSKLQEIYNNTPEIQITKTFELNVKTSEKNTSANNQSIDKPNIEFVDIPAGTFMMGSPASENGRNDDEIQHEVTLSSFKMSKYTVTFEQYDLFCDATGRHKPRGRKRGNLPISQVTWHDAVAFAEWMDCRLPTEAEWEYAARANTTTPFNTGECLTSDQANFNGKKPYANCDKGNYRGKALLVGSFSPNAYGLYDMHGNVLEWCSDWYGEYDLKETSDPTGPDTGGQKVLRSGGWGESASACRSACRDKIYPGNKGSGMSFRLVKSE